MKKIRLRKAIRLLVLVAILGLGIAAHTSRFPDVFVGKNVFFLDPDCYSRMTRVVSILEGGGWSIRQHGFENAPQGTAPHTTAPLDLMIAAGACLAKPVPGAPDLAGAWISPALGFVFLVGIACLAWGRRFGLAGLLLAAVSPILAHAFSVGRPDHQSLLVLLVAGALWMEWKIWTRQGGGLGSGVLWALSLWVSLYEPLVLMALCLALRVFVLRKDSLGDCRAGLLAFVMITAAAVVFDGWRMTPLPPEVGMYFQAWSSEIGELRGAPASAIFGWVGWLMPVSVLILFFAGWKRGLRPLTSLGILLLVTMCLTIGTSRWGCFFAMVAALSVPPTLVLIRPGWLAWSLFLVGLWPVASMWDSQLFPEEEARNVARNENLLLHGISMQLRSRPDGIVLAPWWLSPAIAYWSGKPCVSGSSHQSLPGIVDSARFYLATDDSTGRDILQQREVSYVVGDDPGRIEETSRQLLGLHETGITMADRLAGTHPPDFLMPITGNAYFRLYLVK